MRPRSTPSLLALSLTLSSACMPTGPGTVERTPDPARNGSDGSEGAYGAALVTIQTQARVTERVTVDVVFPSDSAGNLDRRGAPYPVIVFTQGGLVPSDRYRWLAKHFATRGYVTLSTRHVLDLAIFQVDNGTAALQALRRTASTPGHTLANAVAPTGPVVAMGHSLGGVIASWQWVQYGYAGVVLLASFPEGSAEVSLRAGTPVLSITGDRDGLARVPDVTAGLLRFSPPRLLAVVQGMNHFDWTEGASPSELSRDQSPTRPQTATRTDALRVIDTWLDATLRSDPQAQQALTLGSFSGVTVSR
ncbi:MAG: alpha/beta hydrolase [Deltaproteobacteria bacterium]|nr:alpha/beta hydrolase [Deltaproteobacteria bacterium]